jgi:uncharacterized protein
MADPTYAPGTPCWVDLGTPDVDASKAFYGELFGWTAHTSPDPQFGGYTLFHLGDKEVAGCGPLMSPNQPPAWSTYVATADAKATAEKARSAGGQVIVEPMQVADQGTMAIFMDPTGAAISAWQPDAHPGAALVNVPGSFCWNELATRDMDRAKPFYRAVFNWDARTNQMGEMQYTEWLLDGKSIAGGMPMGDNFPPQVPPHWLTYFAVSDTDAAVSTATRLGARTMTPVMDAPVGRFTVLLDPQGAAFGVITLAGGM